MTQQASDWGLGWSCGFEYGFNRVGAGLHPYIEATCKRYSAYGVALGRRFERVPRINKNFLSL